MKKLLTILIAALLSFSAASISAEGVSFYGGLMGGLNAIEPTTGIAIIPNPSPPPPAIPILVTSQFQVCGFGGVFVGARLKPRVRVEAEYAWENKFRSHLLIKEYQRIQSLMANVFYDKPIRNTNMTSFIK